MIIIHKDWSNCWVGIYCLNNSNFLFNMNNQQENILLESLRTITTIHESVKNITMSIPSKALKEQYEHEWDGAIGLSQTRLVSSMNFEDFAWSDFFKLLWSSSCDTPIPSPLRTSSGSYGLDGQYFTLLKLSASLLILESLLYMGYTFCSIHSDTVKWSNISDRAELALFIKDTTSCWNRDQSSRPWNVTEGKHYLQLWKTICS